jgi:hypothetical protein
MLDRAMYRFYAAIERSPLSIWMREDEYAYFVALILHAFGMALLVGGGIVVCLRMLGAAPNAELPRFAGFFPVMLLGAALAVVSGFALLVAYPAKALTNPLFAVKFACLIGAALLLRAASRRMFPAAARGEPPPQGSRRLAVLALLLWLGGVAAGKLLLHTATILTVT